MFLSFTDPRKIKSIAILFLMTFALASSVFYAARGVAQSPSSVMPASGSCAMLMSLPVPYGFDVGANTTNSGVRGVYQTGYNLIGQIVFNNSSSGIFSGRIINPTFNTANSPFIDANGGSLDLNGLLVQITPMNSTSGFAGGYTFAFSGQHQNRPVAFDLTGVPSNGGKTILMVSSGAGTSNNPGIGPGSGICQL
jgi:hypothetical protein